MLYTSPKTRPPSLLLSTPCQQLISLPLVIILPTFLIATTRNITLPNPLDKEEPIVQCQVIIKEKPFMCERVQIIVEIFHTNNEQEGQGESDRFNTEEEQSS